MKALLDVLRVLRKKSLHVSTGRDRKCHTTSLLVTESQAPRTVQYVPSLWTFSISSLKVTDRYDVVEGVTDYWCSLLFLNHSTVRLSRSTQILLPKFEQLLYSDPYSRCAPLGQFGGRRGTVSSVCILLCFTRNGADIIDVSEVPTQHLTLGTNDRFETVIAISALPSPSHISLLQFRATVDDGFSSVLLYAR